MNKVHNVCDYSRLKNFLIFFILFFIIIVLLVIFFVLLNKTPLFFSKKIYEDNYEKVKIHSNFEDNLFIFNK